MSNIKKNITQSVRDRLLKQARELNIDFNRMLILYIQERFLYRLSQSKYKNNLILKGGVLFYIFFRTDSRPTRDIDFTGSNVKNDPAKLIQVINDIINIDVNDGLRFDKDKYAEEGQKFYK